MEMPFAGWLMWVQETH